MEKYLRTVEKDEDTIYCVREFNTPDKILSALKIPDLVKVRGDSEVTSNIFMANKSNTAQMHFDGDHRHVFLYQVFGRKRIIMIHPDQAKKLNPVLNQSWLMLQNYTEAEKQAFIESTDAWDYTLEPGDTVYFPMMMWHHLEYTDTGLSVNFRFGRSEENRFFAEHIHRDMYTENVAWLVDFETPPDYFNKALVMQMIHEELGKFANSPIEKYQAMRDLFREIYYTHCKTALKTDYFISSDETIIDASKALSSLASQPYHFNNWMRFHGRTDALTSIVQELKSDAQHSVPA
jgi:lysine-specific demethylase 8